LPLSAATALPQSWPLALRYLVRLIAGQADPSERLGEADWDAFADLAIERHRIAPAVVAAVRDAGVVLPDRIAEALHREAAANLAQRLNQKAETVRILRRLEEKGCRPAVLKGWPLAEALFGTDAGRHARDLDLYVDAGEVEAAVEALLALGYAFHGEHVARQAVFADAAFQSEFNDLGLMNPETGVLVELHWRSTHFRGWTDLRDIPGAWDEMPVDGSGVTVRVPSATANLIYLSLHGQHHLWLRLKWLLDIARCLDMRPETDLLADLDVARKVGAGRAVVIAGHLAERVLGAPLPRDWPGLDSAGERAVGKFLQMIGDPDSAPGRRKARIQCYWTALWMAETPSQRAGVLRYGLWRRLRFAGAGLGFARG